MHAEADAFLDAIFDNPDDDTPRLVYSDWLQEHGQESYAQFIRLQCAATREKLGSDEANRRWEEIGCVWTKLDDEWWPATRDEFGWSGSFPVLLDAVHFQRGFLRSYNSISLPPAWIIRYAVECPSFLSTFEALFTEPFNEHDQELLAAVRELKKHFRRIHIL